jgi:hypothetical protein
MQEKQLFEYAVMRIVPRVEREEFLNVGVVMYMHGSKKLSLRCHLPEHKLIALDPKAGLSEIREYLQAFEQICLGAKDAGPIGQLDAASRFRWLTAYRSTIIQTSRVHPGFCSDPEKELERLFAELAG